ncbi:MAG: hypothetical protein ABJA94_10865, partial [Rhodoglobus sp.]
MTSPIQDARDPSPLDLVGAQRSDGRQQSRRLRLVDLDERAQQLLPRRSRRSVTWALERADVARVDHGEQRADQRQQPQRMVIGEGPSNVADQVRFGFV